MTVKRERGRAKQARNVRLLRREPLCRHCAARGVTRAAAVLDHIVPLAKGGAESDDNLQPLCVECHNVKTAADFGATPAVGPDGWPVHPAPPAGLPAGAKASDDDLDAPGRLTLA